MDRRIDTKRLRESRCLDHDERDQEQRKRPTAEIDHRQ
jgi:hypothetical protein